MASPVIPPHETAPLFGEDLTAKKWTFLRKVQAFSYSYTGIWLIFGLLLGAAAFLLFFPEALLFISYMGKECKEIWTNEGQHYYKCRAPMGSLSGQVRNPPPKLG